MKKTYVMLLIGIFIFTSVFVFNGCSRNDNVIKIGAILPLTGDAALYGNNAKDGIELAVREINKSGGIIGKRIEVIYEDSKADPNTAVQSFNKLVAVDNIEALIGGITSSVTLAIAPLANEKEIVVLSPAATSPKLTKAGEYIFRNWTSDAYEGEVISNYILNNLNIKTIAILWVNNDYGKGLEEVFERKFNDSNVSIVISESFEQNESDFRTQLSKIKNKKPDAIYIVSYPKEIIKILKQIKELDINSIIISTSAFQDDEILSETGNLSEGVIYPYPVNPDPNDKVVDEFLVSFQEHYGKEPGIVCDTGYDALNMISYAIKKKQTYNGVEIKNELSKLHNYHGASGIMSFDDNGDVEKIMKIKTVENNRFIEIK